MTGVQKWIFFVLAACAGGGLFGTMYFMVKENASKFPDDARYMLRITSALFFLSWGSFPTLYLIGPPGFNLVSQEYDVALHSLADILSKNLFGFSAWYVRWNLVNNQLDENGKLVLSRKATISARLRAKASQGGTTLSEEDITQAKKNPFTVLLFTSNSLVYKLMSMMLEKVDVTMYTAPNIPTAKTIMSSLPCDSFDAVIVVPGFIPESESRYLREFSEFICQPPYKIPMLGVYFDEGDREEEPGYYIHGIIPRPLDEYAVKATLLEWRLTALMWKRVADSVEAIEGYQQNPALRGQKRQQNTGNQTNKNGILSSGTFGNQMMPSFLLNSISGKEQSQGPSTESEVLLRNQMLAQQAPFGTQDFQPRKPGQMLSNSQFLNSYGDHTTYSCTGQTIVLGRQNPDPRANAMVQNDSGANVQRQPIPTSNLTPAHTPSNSQPTTPRVQQSVNVGQNGQNRVRFS